MFRLLVNRRIQKNMMRTFVTLFSLVVAILIPLISFYFSFIEKVFEKQQSSNIVAYDDSFINLRTINVSNDYIVFSDSFFNMLENNDKILSYRKIYSDYFNKYEILWENLDTETVYCLFGIINDGHGIIFPQGQLEELNREGKNAIVFGREFLKDETGVMLISTHDCLVNEIDPEEAVGSYITICSTESDKQQRVKIVGVYDNFLSERGNRNAGGYNEPKDYIFSSDVVHYFKEGTNDSKIYDPTSTEINLKSMNDLEDMIGFIENEYGYSAPTISEQLLGITFLTGEYGRMFKVLAWLSYIVVFAMFFSVLYRNIQEETDFRMMLRSLGMRDLMIRRLQRREAMFYGFWGCLIGSVLGFLGCTVLGMATMMNKPEFKTVLDVLPRIETVLIPVLICLVFVFAINEILIIITGRIDGRKN